MHDGNAREPYRTTIYLGQPIIGQQETTSLQYGAGVLQRLFQSIVIDEDVCGDD